ncbi:ABC transporter permease [Verticiella sediminum]|uniref:ABC transporter permease n=2 Tax=Verticiella sediminum TaxID=1247510 RepID=A0A556AH01_9BURK|nr:ABC transporter permease [Verticiella sediminum]
MRSPTPPPAAAPSAATPRRRTGLARGWHRFRSNRLAFAGTLVLVVLLVVALLAPWIAPYPDDIADAVHFDVLLQPPSWQHWMGTDEAGRDVLTRVMYGARLSFMMVAIVLSIAVAIGVPVGLVAGYFGGRIEQLLMRITDVFSAVPALVLALAITVVLGPSLENAMIALGFVWWRGFARIAHGRTLSIKQENFITVARTLGASHLHIMFREILPNMTSSLLVSLSLNAGYAILVGTSLSFLGAGASPPAAEWGLMVATSRHYLPDAWWASMFPGLAIFVTVMSFNLLGDGLRDFLGED